MEALLLKARWSIGRGVSALIVIVGRDIDDIAGVRLGTVEGRAERSGLAGAGFLKWGLPKRSGRDKAHRLRLQHFGKSFLGDGSDRCTHRWNQKGDCNDVGQYAGGDQEDAGDEHRQAIEDAIGGKFPLAELFFDIGDGSSTLELGEDGAEQSGADHEANGWPQPDLHAKRNQQGQFHKRDDRKECEKLNKHGWTRFIRRRGRRMSFG